MWRDPDRNPDGAPLEADHSRSRANHGTTGNHADRLLHMRCNRERGDGSRDHQRPAITGHTPAPHQPDPALGHQAMPWP